jgi:hypothetical protein
MVEACFPSPGPDRDAFVDLVGRDLTELGQQLTDSGTAALSPDPVTPLPPLGPTFD